MTWATGLKRKFEKENPGATVTLNPIQAPENDYYTKLDLMQRSSSTAPDVLYEDTFLIKSDVAAGYLLALGGRLKHWPDWSKEFFPQSRVPTEGSRRQGLWGADGDRHPGSLVQQGDLQEGRTAGTVAPQDLERLARRDSADQGQGAGRDPVQHLLRHARRRSSAQPT